MSAEIVDLTAAKGEPDQDLLHHIERLLVKAKNGEIDSIAYATVTPKGEIGSGYSIAGNRSFLALAATLRLMRRLEMFALD